MNHPTEEQLILHYYSETDDLVALEQHLGACESCGALYHAVERALKEVDGLPVPEREPGYEALVWARLQPRLAARRGFTWFAPEWRWAIAGAVFASLLVLAFVAGRYTRRPPAAAELAAAWPAQRALQIAIGTHLERSQMVLTELANASAAGPLDISFEQERAADLLGENRLYRQSATGAGDALVAGVLDDLERILLEIEHAPARISPAELDELRLRLQTDGILFKLRVLGSNVRNQADPTRKPL
jgi:hypothetical protein